VSLLHLDEEAARLAEKDAKSFDAVLNRLIGARVAQDADAYRSAMADAAELFERVFSMADLLGRRRIQMLADRAEHDAPVRARMAVAALAGETPLVPRVEFKEAVADILSRRPEISTGWKATLDVYERRGIAVSREMDVAVVKRLGELVAQAIDGRLPSPRVAVQELRDWSAAQADLIYTMNVKTAYSAGAWQRLEDPAVARVLLGMKFVSALMVTTRPNHRAAHGLVAPTDDLLWNVFGGHLGWNCHCTRREVSVYEAKRMGWLDAQGKLRTILPPSFSKAGPDPGFTVSTRPDRAVQGGGLG